MCVLFRRGREEDWGGGTGGEGIAVFQSEKLNDHPCTQLSAVVCRGEVAAAKVLCVCMGW